MFADVAPPSEYSCPHCLKAFSQKSNRDAHVRSLHLGILFTCDICSWTTKFGSEMTRHKQGKHGHPRDGEEGVKITHTTVKQDETPKPRIYRTTNARKDARNKLATQPYEIPASSVHELSRAAPSTSVLPTEADNASTPSSARPGYDFDNSLPWSSSASFVSTPGYSWFAMAPSSSGYGSSPATTSSSSHLSTPAYPQLTMSASPAFAAPPELPWEQAPYAPFDSSIQGLQLPSSCSDYNNCLLFGLSGTSISDNGFNKTNGLQETIANIADAQPPSPLADLLAPGWIPSMASPSVGTSLHADPVVLSDLSLGPHSSPLQDDFRLGPEVDSTEQFDLSQYLWPGLNESSLFVDQRPALQLAPDIQPHLAGSLF
ncbi:hypothetical protein HWV62_3406 [Athelia sp. TMB]|nr:hypothetical protein HWV62_14988 [Athelia sp. TMB]KAF7977469.1 hypothetical protein HWV62_3406 [Athelia sp. TMB]